MKTLIIEISNNLSSIIFEKKFICCIINNKKILWAPFIYFGAFIFGNYLNYLYLLKGDFYE